MYDKQESRWFHLLSSGAIEIKWYMLHQTLIPTTFPVTVALVSDSKDDAALDGAILVLASEALHIHVLLHELHTSLDTLLFHRAEVERALDIESLNAALHSVETLMPLLYSKRMESMWFSGHALRSGPMVSGKGSVANFVNYCQRYQRDSDRQIDTETGAAEFFVSPLADKLLIQSAARFIRQVCEVAVDVDPDLNRSQVIISAGPFLPGGLEYIKSNQESDEVSARITSRLAALCGTETPLTEYRGSYVVLSVSFPNRPERKS